MARQCIMCDQSAGSKEHIFPAALGGRRVNKGIYCEKHNNSLGVHVASLLDVLSIFNASMGVRHDRHDQPKPHVLSSTDGDKYQILRDHVELAPPPPLTQTPDLVGKPVTLKFAGTAQREKWMAEQRKLGFDFELAVASPVQTQYFTEPFKQRLELGTEPFRRAIAYVALTYVAHYFPDIARQDGLKEIKLCVLGGLDVGDRVWWLNPVDLSLAADPNFKKVHSIVVAVSEATGMVTAAVSFFGKLCMAVDLGKAEVAKTERVITHVNPLAEHAALDHDINIRRDVGVELVLCSVDDGKAYIQGVVNGVVPNPVAEIFGGFQSEHLRVLLLEALPKLHSAEGMDYLAREKVVREFVDAQGQRVFNLIREGVIGFLELDVELPKLLRRKLEGSISADAEGSFGLSSDAFAALEVGKKGLVAEIMRILDEGNLDEENLGMLLCGGKGMEVVVGPVLHAIINSDWCSA